MAPGKSNEKDSKQQADQNIKEDGYEPVSHEDADTPSSGSERPSEDLSLQRFENNFGSGGGQDEEDSDDDDEHAMSHPIFGMLANRLGQRRRGSVHKYDKLHPENQVLTVANVNDCVEVESAFPEAERCTREKFEYRLTKCPELCLGIFSQPTKAEVQGGNKQKRRLIAHIIGTRTSAPCVTDESMDYPRDWKSAKQSSSSGKIGHDEMGDTICIHSLAVKKDCQSLGIGSVLLRSYIQRMKDAKIASRLALLAHDDMKNFYGRFGFEDMGPSQATFGSGDWNNMILEFSDLADD